MQPRIVLVGPLEAIEECHVLLDEKLYDVESPSKALEVAFKMIWALNARYPPESKNIWVFIQRAVFDLRIPGEEQLGTKISSLLAKIFPDDKE